MAYFYTGVPFFYEVATRRVSVEASEVPLLLLCWKPLPGISSVVDLAWSETPEWDRDEKWTYSRYPTGVRSKRRDSAILGSRHKWWRDNR